MTAVFNLLSSVLLCKRSVHTEVESRCFGGALCDILTGELVILASRKHRNGLWTLSFCWIRVSVCPLTFTMKSRVFQWFRAVFFIRQRQEPERFFALYCSTHIRWDVGCGHLLNQWDIHRAALLVNKAVGGAIPRVNGLSRVTDEIVVISILGDCLFCDVCNGFC